MRDAIPAFTTVKSAEDHVKADIAARERDLVVGVWNGVDVAGHGEHSAMDVALQKVDTAVGSVLKLVHPNDHVLLIADHGHRVCKWYQFMCMAHYGGRAEEVYTPMMISGPQIQPGQLNRRVTHQDTSYYILNALNRSVPCDWEVGKLASCNSSWPGPDRDMYTIEEHVRDSIDVAILVVGILIALLLCTAVGRWIRKRRQEGAVKDASAVHVLVSNHARTAPTRNVYRL